MTSSSRSGTASAFPARVRRSELSRRVLGRDERSAAGPDELPDAWVRWQEVRVTEDERIRLVLDGVLEIEDGGGPRSGAAAAGCFCERWRLPAPADELAERSMLAVRLAQGIDCDSAARLSQWLYAFGQTPAALAEVRTGRTRDGVLRFTDRARLETRYACQIEGDWEVWGLSGDPEHEESAPRHKLYVSPANPHLDEVTRRAVDLLCDSAVPAFKLASSRRVATRPDKFIVYFHTARDLESWASQLATSLADCRGHGVPFTSQMHREPVLSRAVDPDPAGRSRPESWRSWCTDRLGWSLAVARRDSSRHQALPPWQFALFRLGLDGVDVARWCCHAGPAT